MTDISDFTERVWEHMQEIDRCDSGVEGFDYSAAEYLLSMPEMIIIHDLLSLLSRTSDVKDLVLGNLADHPSLLEWVQSPS